VQCPYCGGDSQVVDSRASAEGVRRRRNCNDCKRRFTTYEKLAPARVKVVKRSGKSEPFDKDKLARALARVLRGRPDAARTDELAERIEKQLVADRVKSIASGELAMRVLELLRDLDRIAYDRLAINYLDDEGRLRAEPPRPAPPRSQLDLPLDDDEP
jgi:transcriptional repressor NrdR